MLSLPESGHLDVGRSNGVNFFFWRYEASGRCEGAKEERIDENCHFSGKDILEFVKLMLSTRTP